MSTPVYHASQHVHMCRASAQVASLKATNRAAALLAMQKAATGDQAQRNSLGQPMPTAGNVPPDLPGLHDVLCINA